MKDEHIALDAARRRIALPGRGIEIGLLDFGGEGPLALLHHANGFCAALWAPVAEALRERFRVVAMDARGHGDSSLPAEGAASQPDAFAWPTLRDDLLAVADAVCREVGASRIALGLGHSFGGTLTLAAAAERPGLFERIVLVDPVILPPMTYEESMSRAQERGLAERSRRRRHTWPDREAARAYCAERELFASWQPRAIDLYVAEGMRARAGGEIELKCPGAVEAAVFEGAHTLDIFGAARRAELPVHILWAAHGNFPREIYVALSEGMRDVSIEDVAAGHLVPMEDPAAVVAAVLRHLD